MKINFRAGFNYDLDAAVGVDAVDCSDDPGVTIQSQREEADINTIVKRFGITGTLPQNVRAPILDDFRGGDFDFMAAQNAVLEAQRSFMKMPAEVRSRFNNDPGLFVEFCSDEKNLPDLIKMGLVVDKTPKPADPLRVVVVTPEA